MKRIVIIRKKYLFTFCFLILYLCSLFSQVSAQDDAVCSFLDISPSPRANALGDAYISVIGNADSIYYNPAVSSFIGWNKISFHSVSPVQLTHYRYEEPLITHINFSLNYISYFQSLNYGGLFSTFSLSRYGTIGLGFMSLFYDDVKKTGVDSLGNYYLSNDSINLKDYCFLINYGYRINNKIGIGITLKNIVEQLDKYKEHNMALDIGLLYRKKEFGFGLAVKNLVSSKVKFIQEQYDLPVQIAGGGHIRIYKGETFLYSQDELLFTSEIQSEELQQYAFGLGMEYKWRKTISLRIGGQLDDNNFSLRLGTGLDYKQYRINYSFNSYENLGSVHRISLSVFFNNQGEFVPHSRSQQTSIIRLIEQLPDNERATVEEQYFQGLDKYYKGEINEAIMIWKEIKTENKKLQDRIQEKIKILQEEKKKDSLHESIIKLIEELPANEMEHIDNMYFYGLGKYYRNNIKQAVNIWQSIDSSDKTLLFLIQLKIKEIKQENEKQPEKESILALIDQLPLRERKTISNLYYYGLGKYYKDDKKRAIAIWKRIKTTNKRLQSFISEKIKSTEKEL